MTSPSIHDLSTTDVTEPQIVFEDGDVALIIKPNGDVHTVAFQVDTAVLSKPEDELTEADMAVLRQGQIAFALSLAAQSQMVMSMLIEIASDPEVVDMDKLKQAIQRH